MTPANDPYSQYQPPFNPYMTGVPSEMPNFGQSFTPAGGMNVPRQLPFQNQMQSYQPPKAPPMSSGSTIAPTGKMPPVSSPPTKSYMENIFINNRGKVATFYFTFQNNSEWNAKVIKGILIAAGRDYVLIKEVASDHRWLMPTINFDFAVFDEQVDQ